MNGMFYFIHDDVFRYLSLSLIFSLQPNIIEPAFSLWAHKASFTLRRCHHALSLALRFSVFIGFDETLVSLRHFPE